MFSTHVYGDEKKNLLKLVIERHGFLVIVYLFFSSCFQALAGNEAVDLKESEKMLELRYIKYLNTSIKSISMSYLAYIAVFLRWDTSGFHCYTLFLLFLALCHHPIH